MEPLFYDLHMHSCLSPCGDDDMTPNNLVNMAALKELDVIALTDHNCSRNLPAAQAVAEQAGLLFVPGIEVNTAEEVHMLAYFEDVEQAVAYGEEIYASLPDIPNCPSLFGNQYVMDSQDEIVGTVDKLLLNACGFSLDRAAELGRARARAYQSGRQRAAGESGLYSAGHRLPHGRGIQKTSL